MDIKKRAPFIYIIEILTPKNIVDFLISPNQRLAEAGNQYLLLTLEQTLQKTLVIRASLISY